MIRTPQAAHARTRGSITRRTVGALGAVAVAFAALAGFAAPPVAASGSSSVGLYLSEPGVEGPSLAGVTIETFAAYDGVSALTPTTLPVSTSLAVGSVAAGSMKAAFSGVGASTTTDTVVGWNRGGGSAIGYLDANQNVTIDLGTPRNYLGFLWLAGDGGNRFVLRSEGREVGTFSTQDIITLVPKTAGTVSAIGGAAYTKTEYYGSRYHNGPGTCGSCNEPFAFIHLVAPAGVTFDEVELRQGSGGGFEFDNLTVANVSGPFDFTGLVGVPMDQPVNDAFAVELAETLLESVATNDVTLVGSTFSKLTDPTLGTATLSPNGDLTFVAGSVAGVTSFDYRVCRPAPSTTCVTATVTITVGAIPEPPAVAPTYTG